MNIKQNFITSKSRPRQTLTPVGVVLHDCGTPGATPQNEHDYFQNSAPSASAHVFVGANEIIQLIPWNEVAWHAGHTANHKFLSVELCNPKSHDVEEFNKIWANGVDVFVYLYREILKITTLNADNFWTHARISNTYHETDHQDPIAYFKEYGKTVDQFEAEVQAKLNGKPVVFTKPSLAQVVVDSVTDVQNALSKLGYSCGAADGVAGPKTIAATKAFQKAKGLVVDGVAGPNTKAALLKALTGGK